MYLIAYSGGMDSSALLHQYANTHPRDKLRAIHVNHGLYPEADAWQSHCEKTCADLNIPLTCVKLQSKPPEGESIEAWARDKRRAVFAEHLQENESLVTGQHADDQAETLLLQLLRGAGPKGLSAMPAEAEFEGRRHIRPMLKLSKQDIHHYVREHEIDWVNDHSNQDTQFDRNFLREKIIPVLKQRWPSLEKTLSRSAAHCAEQELLVQLLLAPLFIQCQGSKLGTLSIQALQRHPAVVQRALVRHWLGEKKFPMPGHKKFENIFQELIPARADASPLIAWGEVCIRRYRDDLYALYLSDFEKVMPRQAGMKKAFQEQGIPPWERFG